MRDCFRLYGFLSMMLIALGLSCGKSPQPRAFTLQSAQRAADRGDSEAQYFLGKSYSKGIDVERDYAKAAEYFRKAADQGHAFAKNDLAVLYAKGLGVPKDYEQAAKWYLRGANAGDSLAQF